MIRIKREDRIIFSYHYLIIILMSREYCSDSVDTKKGYSGNITNNFMPLNSTKETNEHTL